MEQSISSPSSQSKHQTYGASAAVSRPHHLSMHLKEEEEEDWPDPPPWPEPEEEQPKGMCDVSLLRYGGLPAPPPHYQMNQTMAIMEPPMPVSKPHQSMHSSADAKSISYLQVQHSSPMSHPVPAHPNPGSPPAATRPGYSPPASNLHPQINISEQVYRGPKPTISKFNHPDPSEFARLRIALENLLPSDTTELFKYQILVDHLRLEEAKLIADAYLNSPTPYTDTMRALYNKFGQPHQLALKKIASVLEAPEIKRG
ncbi:uncharacterized protein LOC112141569, partial [Oryzias melastigma]|uniref:uncharacterized protein LOC112141569 n=1 Tax=Oryzias melastigma TaxID=30732 RepID=UPI00168D9515